jgi:hypothetical protein
MKGPCCLHGNGAAIVWVDALIGAPYRPVLASVLPALSTTPRELSAVAGTVPSSKALAQAVGALGGSLALGAAAPQTVVFAAAGVFFRRTRNVVASAGGDAVRPGQLASRAGATARLRPRRRAVCSPRERRRRLFLGQRRLRRRRNGSVPPQVRSLSSTPDKENRLPELTIAHGRFLVGLDRRWERATIACPCAEGQRKTSPSQRW